MDLKCLISETLNFAAVLHPTWKSHDSIFSAAVEKCYFVLEQCLTVRGLPPSVAIVCSSATDTCQLLPHGNIFTRLPCEGAYIAVLLPALDQVT